MEKGRAAIATRGIDTLVVAGGDGMVHLGANLCAGTDVPLGVIAAGTGNDVARELGLPVRDAAKSVERILAGATRRVDAGSPRHGERGRAVVSSCAWPARVRRPVVNERANSGGWPKGSMRSPTSRSCASCPSSAPSRTSSISDGRRVEPEAMLVDRSATARPTARGCG
jgi:diacylglycerol kinase (ATP)